MVLSGSSGWHFTLAPGGEDRLFPSTIESPVSSLLKSLHFSFSPICQPYTCTLWWIPLPASRMASEPLGNVLQQVSVYGLCVPSTRGQDCRWLGGLQVSVYLPSPVLYVVGRALGVSLDLLYNGEERRILPVHTTWQWCNEGLCLSLSLSLCVCVCVFLCLCVGQKATSTVVPQDSIHLSLR